MPKVNVLILYTHQDRSYLERLKLFLHEKTCPYLNVWDEEIDSYDQRGEILEKQLNGAQIILLLLSQDFLVSDFIERVELKTALERSARKECYVIPIFARHFDLSIYPQITSIKGFPSSMNFLSDLGDKVDSEFSHIQKELNKIASSMITDKAIENSIKNASTPLNLSPPKNRAKIFISYCRQDESFALQLVNDLRKKNVNVWIDQLDIPLGARWDIEIENALDTSDFVIFIASEHSVKSENVLNELNFAIENGKKLIPVMLSQCRLPLRYLRLQRIDLSVNNYQNGIRRLVDALSQ